ncbi:hypothetical protein [Streptomyces griseus]|uniref:hypothetical protein n=1 Tax=Streptomyces griseus TaxID=1911 RepID=UPI00366A4A23
MSTVIEVDLGPGHYAHGLEVNGEWMCALNPAVATDERIQALVRRFMAGEGRDCRKCRGCIVGTAQ